MIFASMMASRSVSVKRFEQKLPHKLKLHWDLLCLGKFNNTCIANKCGQSKNVCDQYNLLKNSLTFFQKFSLYDVGVIKFVQFNKKIKNCFTNTYIASRKQQNGTASYNVCKKSNKCLKSQPYNPIFSKLNRFALESCPCTGKYSFSCGTSLLCGVNKKSCEHFQNKNIKVKSC